MENGNEVLKIMLTCLAGAGVAFVYLLCKLINVGENERKAKMKIKNINHDTKNERIFKDKDIIRISIQ